MRLIDKDLILKTATDKEWGLWCEIVNIKFAPEVKAIPIEWIEKWVDRLKERNYHNYQVLMPALIEMLGAWEKENEK